MSWTETFAVLFAKLPQIACILVAGWLAANNKSAWPWFLLIGILLTSSVYTGKAAEIRAECKALTAESE